MSNPPDNPPGEPLPDPAAPPPSSPDGTGTPFTPGHARVPQPEPYEPTAAFPPVDPTPTAPYETGSFDGGPINYAPPGYAPDHGQPYGYPPPDYARSAYPHGYPTAPATAPPGYGVPPAPRRRGSGPVIVAIVVGSLLLCGGVVTAGVLISQAITDRVTTPLAHPSTTKPRPATTRPTAPTRSAGQPGQTDESDSTIKVTYEVKGDGPADIVYFAKLGDGPTRLHNVRLPWKFTTTMQTPTLVSVTAVRIGTSEGEVSCRALVNGQEVKSSTSPKGAVTSVSCMHFALD